MKAPLIFKYNLHSSICDNDYKFSIHNKITYRDYLAQTFIFSSQL